MRAFEFVAWQSPPEFRDTEGRLCVEPLIRFPGPYPRWEPYAGKPHVRNLGGRREVTRVAAAKMLFAALHESSYGTKRNRAVQPESCPLSRYEGPKAASCVLLPGRQA